MIPWNKATCSSAAEWKQDEKGKADRSRAGCVGKGGSAAGLKNPKKMMKGKLTIPKGLANYQITHFWQVFG